MSITHHGEIYMKNYICVAVILFFNFTIIAKTKPNLNTGVSVKGYGDYKVDYSNGIIFSVGSFSNPCKDYPDNLPYTDEMINRNDGDCMPHFGSKRSMRYKRVFTRCEEDINWKNHSKIYKETYCTGETRE
jgi:hypothetical protein